jgi:hypothetical protein
MLKVIPVSRRNRVEPSELSFVTNEELIAELMRRKTFLGVVVQSETDLKAGNWGAERNFLVHFNGNLETEEASRLLNRVSSYLDCHC